MPRPVEAWIIQALVREDGMSQVEVAELLGRHKSWVCRRLALIERLRPTARDELRVGLLSPTAARQIVRSPEGNQAEVLETIRREALSGAELAGVVDLWLGCAERRQQEYLLRHPREALSQATEALPAVHDPRLSEDGNKVWKRVGLLLELARHAQEIGVGAISSVPPFYYAGSVDGMLHHYSRIAAACELPLILYNIPSAVHVIVTPELMSRFLGVKTVCGIKFSSYQLFHLWQMVQLDSERLSVLSGNDEVMLAALAMGAHGAIGHRRPASRPKHTLLTSRSGTTGNAWRVTNDASGGSRSA